MKKPYKKPEIKKVQLKPEEAVLTKCRNNPQGCSIDPITGRPENKTGQS